VITPLLSRSRVLVLEPLSKPEITTILKNSRKKLKATKKVQPSALDALAELSGGDARVALGNLELSLQLAPKVTPEIVKLAAQRKMPGYDKKGDMHYNVISAFIKSLRGSDATAALYYLARMLEAGEDPLYIVRRMVRFASEDIGLADTHALVLAIATKNAVEFLGMPESNTAMIELAVYLSRAPKSNACYRAVNATKKIIEETGALPPPLHIRNAVTKLMKNWGYGQGYKYAHDYENAKVDQKHLPEKIEGETFFES
jgi:putative ATPase